MKMSATTLIAAVLTVVLLVASTRVVEGQSDCASRLIPCADYLNSTNPSAMCCNALREVVRTQLPCLCNLYRTPGLFSGMGINDTQALLLPRNCNLPSDTTACNALAPGSSTVPAVPGGPGGNGAGRNSWTGKSALLLALAVTFLY
ncbi:hypothetical protein ACJIZ3_006098 [Penstemon smallii]|uniref:Bifunctional inhibitor/plant lipid transfer protein/seed storage helical domain-containing protein n=1 Tax=Penstemon smallii TaxID=265156 RepID=A0ABD3S6S5_9LAMI